LAIERVGVTPRSAFNDLQLSGLRCGSFLSAADELGITPAAVGQRVKALEDYLGIALLLRTRGGIRPTPELEQALPAVSRAFENLEEGMEQLEAQRGQDIHIAAPSDVVDLWLMPRLAKFRAAHRNVRLCISGEGDAPLRLGRVDVELGFELVQGPDVEPLFRDVILGLASPLNIIRLADRETASRLEGFPLLHLDLYRNDPAGLSWPDWVRANKMSRSAPERGMRFQRAAAALDAVAADAGLALCGLALAAPAMAEKRAALAWPVATGLLSGNPLSVRSSSLAAPHVRRFRAWLLEERAKTRAWITTHVKS
jgi:LysR family glycine cleavage system transcriptional activator